MYGKINFSYNMLITTKCLCLPTWVDSVGLVFISTLASTKVKILSVVSFDKWFVSITYTRLATCITLDKITSLTWTFHNLKKKVCNKMFHFCRLLGSQWHNNKYVKDKQNSDLLVTSMTNHLHKSCQWPKELSLSCYKIEKIFHFM